MTSKQIHIYDFVAEHPGCSTADIHRAVGRYYAHGHHRFTYDSVHRMLARGILRHVPLATSNTRSTKYGIAVRWPYFMAHPVTEAA